MKKRIISAVLSAAMLGTSVFSVPFVSAETVLITDTEKIYDLAKAYVEENLDDIPVAASSDGGVELDINNPTGPWAPYKFVYETLNAITELMNTNKDIDIRSASDKLDLENPEKSKVEVRVGSEEAAQAVREYTVSRGYSEDVLEMVVDPDFLPVADSLMVRPGDLNYDALVDVTDLSNLSLALIGDLTLTPEGNLAADIDGDGEVTIADLARLQQYLSKKISRRELLNITLVSIVDITERDMLSVPAAIEKFYEDENFVYEFGGIKSSYVECTFSNGAVMNVKDALAGGMVTISDLDKYGIDYRRTTTMIATVKEVKGDTLFLTPAEGSKELRSSDLIAVKWDSADQRFKAGDTVRVEYNGIVITTYPEQIDAYSIYLYTETADK